MTSFQITSYHDVKTVSVKKKIGHLHIQHFNMSLIRDVNLTRSSAVAGILICQRDLPSSPSRFCVGATTPLAPFSNYDNIKRNIWR